MNSDFQNKLQQFSANPPDGAWAKIADALDSEESFSQRLFQYEEEPPTAAWQKIESALENGIPAKVIPFFTRFRTPLRYTAVASVIAVTLVTITLTVKRTEAGALEPASSTTVPSASISTAQKNDKEKTSNDLTSSEPATLKARDKSETSPGGSKPKTDVSKDAGPIQAKENNSMAQAKYASLNGYMLFDDGNGQMRKISKKLAGLVNCKDNDGDCKQRLQQLHQKMAASAATTDFTGVLEMLRQLQQKP